MKPKPIVNKLFVAEQIRIDYQNGVIIRKTDLIQRILLHDKLFCEKLGIIKPYAKDSIPNGTLSRFLHKFNIPTTKEFLRSKAKRSLTLALNQPRYIEQDNSTLASTEEFSLMNSEKKFSKSTNRANEDEPVHDAKNFMIQYQGEKIKELTKICCGLSNKNPPSSLLHLSSYSAAHTGNITKNNDDNEDEDEYELEQNRSLHLCIRALVQLLSPIKQILEWIIGNDFLIIKKVTSEDPFQQLANTWFWDGILKYESLEENTDKLKILKRFEHNIKELCKTNDTIFGTKFIQNEQQSTSPSIIFIPPPPQKILDMIIQQHYNHFIEDTNYELPNLPFKKIQLVPPRNIKAFMTVSFCNWRPQLLLPPNYNDEGEDLVSNNENQQEDEIYFAELTWDKEQLTYVHFAWPKYEEDVILEKGWPYQSAGSDGKVTKTVCKNDYQMIGVIWGRQFSEDLRQDGLLPHLGMNKSPVSYIHATKRGTSTKNPKQGRWYLCLDDNYVSSFRPLMLTNNFQDVLLYMDNHQRRKYRPQLLVFQKLNNSCDSKFPLPPIKQIIPSSQQQEKSKISSIMLEPSLKRKPSAYDQTNTLANQFESKVGKKVLLTNPQKKDVFGNINSLAKNSTTRKKYPRSDCQLTSKKKVIQIIDILCESTSSLKKEADEEKYFGYDKTSDYQKGPVGFQLTQTQDQKRYYASKLIFNKD